MSRTRAILLLSTSLFLFQTSCALFGGSGEIERAGKYSVQPLPDWKKADRGESDQAFLLPSKNVVAVTSSCNREAASLDVLTRTLLLGTRKIEYVEKRKMVVDGAEGQFSRVRANFDNVRGYLVLFVITKEDCVFDFSLISNKLIPDEDVDDFLTFVKTFQYGKG